MIANFVNEKVEAEFSSFCTFLQKEIDTDDEWHAYIAFLCLTQQYRRNEEVNDLNKLFHTYRDRFINQPLFAHYEAMMYMANGDYQKSRELSLRMLMNDLYKSNSGILHVYAESVITLAEDKHNEYKVKDEIEDGFARLEEAIRLHDYAKFHATKGRYYLYKKDFTNAKREFREAIKGEKRGSDYQMRISRYHQLLSIAQVKEEHETSKQAQETYNVQLKETINKFSEDIDNQIEGQNQQFEQNKAETAKMIDQMKRENLQMLGFFTAIISFTVGTFQILQNQSFTSAFLLLVTMAGVLLIAYAGFSFTMFGPSEEQEVSNKGTFKKRYLPVFIVGVCMIIFAIMAYQFEWLGVV